jgi:transcription antitermination protein NusB
MSARGNARKRALDFLYEADQRNLSALELLAKRPVLDLSEADYVGTLLSGVESHIEKIDELIATYAQGWDMDRMPAIDRNILRLALFEILWNEEISDEVAVSQAVALATLLSTDDSAKYVNGILGRVIVQKSILI